MEHIIPISWLNNILLITSIIWVIFCLIIGQWTGLTPFPIYISITWCIIVIIGSTWYSCFLMKISLKANSPLNVELIKNLIYSRIGFQLKENNNNEKKSMDYVDKSMEGKLNSVINNRINSVIFVNKTNLNTLINEINDKCIISWYSIVSDEKAFIDESDKIIRKLFEKICTKITVIDKVRLSHKLANILLLHFKEYRRALRRVEKEKAKNIEEAYRYFHPGSRNSTAVEHTLHRLVTIVAREFLQWELTSSLPCKLLLSILAKKLLGTIHEVSSSNWIYNKIIKFLQAAQKDEESKLNEKNNDYVSEGLSKGITSATAALIARPLPQISQSVALTIPIVEITIPEEAVKSTTTDRVSLCLDGLSTIDHKGLWNDLNDVQMDYDDEEDRISPVYEEPTDFATTIARLRNILQQKSTATSPLPTEEKMYAICDGNQFVNLAIPWTEFHTSADGSQQLLYCIQFDDVEQHGEDMFETTTATVRRQYADFVQLHKNLEESPNYASIMANINLPEGGRVEMETYLKTLCSRLSLHTPTQLRHFLRPNSGGSKKADSVAPRFDKFLAKTVTGVFNTLRTVVPGFEMDQEEDTVPLPTLMPLSDIPWRFVEDIKTKNISDEVKMLIADRIDYCSIDTAYEAMETVEGSGDSELISHWWEIVNILDDEELEELDSQLTMTCASIDLICEILAGIGSNNTLQREAVVRWTKLFVGNITEALINEYILKASQHIDQFSIFSKATTHEQDASTEMLKDKLFNLLFSKITIDIKLMFGEDDVEKTIKFLMNSFETKKVNFDFILQLLDIFASELLAACKVDSLELTT